MDQTISQAAIIVGFVAFAVSIIMGVLQIWFFFAQNKQSDDTRKELNALANDARETLVQVRTMQQTINSSNEVTLTRVFDLLKDMSAHPQQLTGQSQQLTPEQLQNLHDDPSTIAAGVMPSVFWVARDQAKKSACQSNLKQLGLAILQYSQDYDERFPDAEKWCEETALYFNRNNRLLACPSEDFPFGYAMNRNLSKVSRSKIKEPERTVLFFDSTKGTVNANDIGESLPRPGRHLERNNFCFVDGHVETLNSEQEKSLIWKVT